MYRVLVVDDEPIILSGIRHMIDWEKEDARRLSGWRVMALRLIP